MILAQALGYLVAAVLQAAAALALVAALTRQLSEVEFGQYGLASAALHLYQSVLFFWLRASVSRFHAAAENEARLDSFLGGIRRGFLWVAVLGLVVGAAGVFLVPGSQGLRATLWVTLVAGTTQGAFSLVLEIHRARLRAWRFSLFQSIQAVLSVALALGLVGAAGGLSGGVYGAALAMAGIALSYAGCAALDGAGMRFWTAPGRPHPGELRAVLIYGAPMTVAMVLDAILATGDRFIIAYFLGEAGVAPYAAGQTLAHRSLMAICTVVGAAAAPLAYATLERHGAAEARARLGDAAELLYAISIPAAFGLAAVAGPISELMVGEALRNDTRILLPWIAAGALLQGIAVHYFQQAFLLARKPGPLLAATGPSMALYIVANVVLVQRFGGLGAAIALIVTQIVQMTAVILVGRRYFEMPLRAATAAKAILASGVMLLALRALPLPGGAIGLAAQVAAGGATYGAIAFALDLARCREQALKLIRRRG